MRMTKFFSEPGVVCFFGVSAMGCGASAAAEISVASSPQLLTTEEKEREQRRSDVLEKYKCTEKDKTRILAYPIFRVPAKYEHETIHTIAYVFFGVRDETCTEVTVFFCEPKELATEIPEQRGVNFSMVKDVERMSYSKVSFNHSWSGTETWDAPQNDEPHTHSEPYSSFEVEKGTRPADASVAVPRPIFYVNTATHLLGCENTNKDLLDCVSIRDYKMFAGTSKQATEILFRAAEAANPDKKEVSPLAQLIPVRASTAPKDRRPKPP